MKQNYTIRLTSHINGKPSDTLSDKLLCTCDSESEALASLYGHLSRLLDGQSTTELRVIGIDSRHLHVEYSLAGIEVSDYFYIEQSESMDSPSW